MNALLKPIEARCIEPCQYDNTRVRHVCLWVNDNEAALRARYAALGKALGDDSEDGLTAFAKAQAFCAWVQCEHDKQTGRF